MAAKKPASKKAPARKTAAKKPAPRKAPAKQDGGAAVAAWIASVKPEQRAIVTRIDALLLDVMPDLTRAIKWNVPFYGREGQGWIATVASFKEYVSLGFFAGASLAPPPPEGESGSMRRVKIHDLAEYDEERLRAWAQQASKLPGWGRVQLTSG